MSTIEEKRAMGAARQRRYNAKKKIKDAQAAEEKAAFDKAQQERIEQLSREVDRWILTAVKLARRYDATLPVHIVWGEYPCPQLSEYDDRDVTRLRRLSEIDGGKDND